MIPPVVVEVSGAGIGSGVVLRDLVECRRSAAAVAGATRNPDAKALADQLSRIGNNLNQIAKVANTKRTMPHFYELRMLTGMVKAALQRVLDL